MQNGELQTALASIARRQNFLAGVPPAMRLLPVAALTGADFLERKYGWNVVEAVLPGLDSTNTDQPVGSGVDSTKSLSTSVPTMWSGRDCQVTLRKSGAIVAYAPAEYNVIPKLVAIAFTNALLVAS